MDRDLAHSTPAYLGPPVDPRGLIVKRPLAVGAAKALGELRHDYHFFTPAPLYLHGQFRDAFLIDHMVEKGGDVPLSYRKFPDPVFAGLATPGGDRDWDHVLMAVPRGDWPGLLDFLCSLTIASREAGAVFRYGEQRLFVVDPLEAERSALLGPAPSLLAVSALGLFGNLGLGRFRRGPTLYHPPRFGFEAARPEDIVYARAYLAGRNPMDARDNYLRRQGPAS